MLLIFTCENCSKRFKVDERLQGKKGRCTHCGHAMRIPRVEVTDDSRTAAAQGAHEVEAEPAFRLSPPDPRPQIRAVALPPSTAEPPAHHPVEPHHSVFHLEPNPPSGHDPDRPEDQGRFELLDDDAEVDQVSPAVKRGLEEIAEFEKDPRAYKIAGDRSGVFSFLGVRDLGPASWLYVKWRAGVNF